MHLKRFTDKIEKMPLSVGGFFYTFIAIVVIRTCFEFLLEPSSSITLFDSFYDSLLDYIHIFFSWMSLFFFIVLWLKSIYKKDIFKIINIVLTAFIVIWIVPFIDYIFYSGIVISYSYEFDSFFQTYIHLFNPFHTFSYISTGVRVEVALVLAMTVLYGFINKLSFVKIIIATAGVYSLIFIFGYLPAVYSFFVQKDFSTLVLNSLLIEKSPTHLLAMMYIPLLLVELGVLLLLLPRHVQQSFFYIIRIERLMIYLGIFVLSVVLALKQSLISVDFLNFYDIGKTLSAMLSIVCAFMYATIINDISDEKADKISNHKRVLVQGLLSKTTFLQFGHICLFFSVAFAILVNQHFIFLMITVLALSYIYSMPPFHLKRFFVISHITLTFIAGLMVILGSCFVEANLAFKKVDLHFLSAVILFYFAASHFKDIKDSRSDKVFKTVTLATLVGTHKAFIIINLSVLFFMVVVSVWILNISFLASLFVGILFVSASLFLKNSEKSILLTQITGFVLLIYYIWVL